MDMEHVPLAKGIRKDQIAKCSQTDKMATVPNGIGLSVQNEHPHTILYKTFLSVSVRLSVKTLWKLLGENLQITIRTFGGSFPSFKLPHAHAQKWLVHINTVKSMKEILTHIIH